MDNNRDFSRLATDESIDRAREALKGNGIEVIIVLDGGDARQKVLEILPERAEVMNMTSVTIDSIGLGADINESGRYVSVRKKLMRMDDETQEREKKRLGAAPEWTVGSVHAVTEDGHVIIASKTGSQFPAYAYGAEHVIWIVGTQKIVKDLNEGMKRVYEYVLPLEDDRARKAYGEGSEVNKLLILNKEVTPGRITMILIKERLGF